MHTSVSLRATTLLASGWRSSTPSQYGCYCHADAWTIIPASTPRAISFPTLGSSFWFVGQVTAIAKIHRFATIWFKRQPPRNYHRLPGVEPIARRIQFSTMVPYTPFRAFVANTNCDSNPLRSYWSTHNKPRPSMTSMNQTVLA